MTLRDEAKSVVFLVWEIPSASEPGDSNENVITIAGVCLNKVLVSYLIK